MILILGPEDIHTLRVKSVIEARGEKACILTSDHYPQRIILSSQLNGDGKIIIGDTIIAQSDIKAVYWYAYSGVCSNSNYPIPEAKSALGSFLRNLNCRWVNPPQAVEQHHYKYHQLKLLHNAGIRVPDTLISSQPEDVLAFYKKHHGNIICKPFYQGLMLHQVKEEDLVPEKLAILRKSPTLFQEYIDGQDVRVHVVGDKLFPSAITSELFNYKTSFKATPIEISPKIQEKCLLATKILGLTLAGVDIRLFGDGKYAMFEANPSPQYLTFEDQWADNMHTFPITEALANCLLTNEYIL